MTTDEIKEKCPMCGFHLDLAEQDHVSYNCGTVFWFNGPMNQSKVCRIRQLETQLAAAQARIAELGEQRDDLKQAVCIARVNCLNQHAMGIRKFAALLGQSPTWVSRWTATDCGPPDLICRAADVDG